MANENRLRSIYDVSFAGSIIVIGGARITEFMDDANPLDIQDVDTCNIEWSCNGRMIRTVKPSSIMMSVTVIPGTASDNALKTIWKKNFCNGGSISLSEANHSLSCSITTGKGGASYTFTGGTIVSGAAALTSNGQGKMGGNTYTFAFEEVA